MLDGVGEAADIVRSKGLSEQARRHRELVVGEDCW